MIYSRPTGATASAYSMGFPSMMRELNCSHEQAALGISMFCLGFALIPLFTSAFSEEFGRRPLYVVCTIVFTAMYIVEATAKNIQTVIAARFICGAFGSTGATMVGGTVADIWEPARYVYLSTLELVLIHCGQTRPTYGYLLLICRRWYWYRAHHCRLDRNVIGLEVDSVVPCHVQTLFSLSYFTRSSLTTWIFSAGGICIVLIVTICPETRTGIMLTRKAEKLRTETGDTRYRAKAEDERGSMKRLLWVSSTRPLSTSTFIFLDIRYSQGSRRSFSLDRADGDVL